MRASENTMIVIDTNVVLASVRKPVNSHDRRHHELATLLLGQIASGSQGAILPEIVMHECFYVLVMRDGDVSVNSFCGLFRRMLAWPGWAMGKSEIGIYIRALDIVDNHPKLEFSDAVIAARAEAHDAELATFDRRLAKAYGGPIWADG